MVDINNFHKGITSNHLQLAYKDQEQFEVSKFRFPQAVVSKYQYPKGIVQGQQKRNKMGKQKLDNYFKVKNQKLLMEVGILNLVSRVGKQSSQKHMVLKHKEEILKGTRKKFSVKNKVLEVKSNQGISFEELQSIMEEEKLKLTEDKIETQTISHVFANQTREEYNKAQALKDKVPDMCHYNVNFSITKKQQLLYRRTPDICFKLRPITTAKIIKENKDPHDVELNPVKHLGLISKQQDRINPQQILMRPDLILEIYGLRYDQKPKDKELLQQKSNQQEKQFYNPNHEYVKYSLGKVGPAFSKQNGRSQSQRKYDKIPEFYDVKSQPLHKSIFSLNFEKQVGRNFQSDKKEKNEINPILPSFMTRIGSRCSHGEQNAKSLKMNCFSKGQFQSITSSFDRPIRNKKSKYQFGEDPLDISFMDLISLNYENDNNFDYSDLP